MVAFLPPERGAAPLDELVSAPAATGRRWREKVAHDWDETGQAWERWEPFLMHSMQGVTIPLLRALAARPGHRVLDVGCGLGEPALSAAAWVAPEGSVVGLDVAASMVRAARRRAAAHGLRNVAFRRGDVTTMREHESFDRVASRFGIMFAEDVPGMLAAMLRALKPGGRAAFAVWAPLAQNPYFRITAEAMAPFVDEVPDPESTPHPMRFARRGRLAGEMEAVGFRGIESRTVKVSFTYPSPDIFADVQMETSGTLRRMSSSLPARALKQIRESMVESAGAFTSGPVVRIPGTAWIVAGDKPRGRR